jgi:hypothetical protein
MLTVWKVVKTGLDRLLEGVKTDSIGEEGWSQEALSGLHRARRNVTQATPTIAMIAIVVQAPVMMWTIASPATRAQRRAPITKVRLRDIWAP